MPLTVMRDKVNRLSEEGSSKDVAVVDVSVNGTSDVCDDEPGPSTSATPPPLTQAQCSRLLRVMFESEHIDKTKTARSHFNFAGLSPSAVDPSCTSEQLLHGFKTLLRVVQKQLTLKEVLEALKHYVLSKNKAPRQSKATAVKAPKKEKRPVSEGAKALVELDKTPTGYSLFLKEYAAKHAGKSMPELMPKIKQKWEKMKEEKKKEFNRRSEEMKEQVQEAVHKLIVKYGIIELMGTRRSFQVIQDPFSLYLMQNFEKAKQAAPQKSDKKIRKRLLKEFSALSKADRPRRNNNSLRTAVFEANIPWLIACTPHTSNAQAFYRRNRPVQANKQEWDAQWFTMDEQEKVPWEENQRSIMNNFRQTVEKYLSDLPDDPPERNERLNAETALCRQSLELYKLVEPVLKYYNSSVSYTEYTVRSTELAAQAKNDQNDLQKMIVNAQLGDGDSAAASVDPWAHLEPHTRDLIEFYNDLQSRIKVNNDCESLSWEARLAKMTIEDSNMRFVDQLKKDRLVAVRSMPLSLLLPMMQDYLIRSTTVRKANKRGKSGFADSEATVAFKALKCAPTLYAFYVGQQFALVNAKYPKTTADGIKCHQHYKERYRQITQDIAEKWRNLSEKKKAKVAKKLKETEAEYEKQRDELLAQHGFENVDEAVRRKHKLTTCRFGKYLAREMEAAREDMEGKSDSRIRKRLLKRFRNLDQDELDTLDTVVAEKMSKQKRLGEQVKKEPKPKKEHTPADRYGNAAMAQHEKLKETVFELTQTKRVSENVPFTTLKAFYLAAQKKDGILPADRKSLDNLSKEERAEVERKYEESIVFFRKLLLTHLDSIGGILERELCELKLANIGVAMADFVAPVCKYFKKPATHPKKRPVPMGGEPSPKKSKSN